MVPQRALIAITSAHAPLYPEGKETGLFITEALHPFKVFKDAGFDVDLVSETGTFQADWLSEQKDWLSDEDRDIWEDHSSEFRTKLDTLLKPDDVKPETVCLCSSWPVSLGLSLFLGPGLWTRLWTRLWVTMLTDVVWAVLRVGGSCLAD